MNFVSIIGIVDNYNEKTNMVSIKVEKHNKKTIIYLLKLKLLKNILVIVLR